MLLKLRRDGFYDAFLNLSDAFLKRNALPQCAECLDSRSLREQELLPAQCVLAGVASTMLLKEGAGASGRLAIHRVSATVNRANQVTVSIEAADAVAIIVKALCPLVDVGEEPGFIERHRLPLAYL